MSRRILAVVIGTTDMMKMRLKTKLYPTDYDAWYHPMWMMLTDDGESFDVVCPHGWYEDFMTSDKIHPATGIRITAKDCTYFKETDTFYALHEKVIAKVVAAKITL